MKPSILCILHLPPPIHGAAVIGQYLHDSKSFNDTFDCHFINLTTASKTSEREVLGNYGLMQNCYSILPRAPSAIVPN